MKRFALLMYMGTHQQGRRRLEWAETRGRSAYTSIGSAGGSGM